MYEQSGSNCVLTMTLILISLLSLPSFSEIYSFLSFSRLEIFIPISATERVSPVSSPELAVPQRGHLVAIFAQESWSGFGHLRKNGYQGSFSRSKTISTGFKLSVDMRFACVYIFLLQNLSLCFYSLFQAHRARIPSRKIEYFCGKCSRWGTYYCQVCLIVNRRPETLAVFSSFCFFAGCLCFLEIFAFIWFAERFTWGASHEERALHRRNASQIFLLGSSASRGLRFERSTFCT